MTRNAVGQTRLGTPHDFEAIYRDAQGDPSRVRWEDGRPNPLLVSWLDRDAGDALRTGARVAVVGCGLGNDARELARRGYDVTAFDVSPTAIEWARSIDADWADI
ncbi:MAG: methyltransferase domain-containing protein, partial [Phycisphaerae bacterium]|nr:methyltransferase domain-containing protein [Phycisphaerae bacterium]